jgi:hypothetical protein
MDDVRDSHGLIARDDWTKHKSGVDCAQDDMIGCPVFRSHLRLCYACDYHVIGFDLQ